MEPGAGNRPELLPQLRLVELLAELEIRLQAVLVAIGSGLDLEFIPVGLREDKIARIHHWPEGRASTKPGPAPATTDTTAT